MTAAAIDVVAGILRDDAGRVLLAQRPAGKDQAGLWEFPGGKREPGETPLAALARELLEELGVEIHDAQPLAAVAHAYPDRLIRLHAWSVHRWTGEPQALDGQSLAWVPVAELDAWPMPPADRPIVTALRLPSRYAITPEPSADDEDFCRRVDHLFGSGLRLVQLRSKVLDAAALQPVASRCARLAERHGADLLLNDQPALAHELGVGLQLSSALLRRLASDQHAGAGIRDPGLDAWLPADSGTRPLAAGSDSGATAAHRRHARGWLAASCHDADELAMAARIGCDFATLSPVLATASHPGAEPLGWDRFAAIASLAALPVYALGGLSRAEEATASAHGARGIAAIRVFWPDD